MGAKFTRVRKLRDFRLKSPFISETMRDRPVVVTERKACTLNKSQLSSLDFTINRFFMKLFNIRSRGTFGQTGGM